MTGKTGRRLALMFFVFRFAFSAASAWAQDPIALSGAPPPLTEAPAPPAPRPAVLPVYLALHPDLHAFRAFSDGGWDGNWYVGFNTCWIVKLPAAPKGEYLRAFLGARLGRAKTRPVRGGASWDREAIPGKVYMGISQTTAFPPAQNFFLADTRDIPQEPDYENPSMAAGHGEWFWAEIPLKLVNFAGPNYLAAWSNTEGLLSASSAPILGAAMDPGPTQEPRAWLHGAIAGVPPRDQNASVGVPVSFYLPALALKLVAPNAAPLAVRAFSASAVAEGFRVRFAAAGQDVETAWTEASPDGLGWERVTPLLRHPPFAFTVGPERFGRPYALAETVQLRAVAQDALGNLAISEAQSLPFAPKQ